MNRYNLHKPRDPIIFPIGVGSRVKLKTGLYTQPREINLRGEVRKIMATGDRGRYYVIWDGNDTGAFYLKEELEYE